VVFRLYQARLEQAFHPAREAVAEELKIAPVEVSEALVSAAVVVEASSPETLKELLQLIALPFTRPFLMEDYLLAARFSLKVWLLRSGHMLGILPLVPSSPPLGPKAVPVC
jgi:hypothetical protein